MIGELIATGLGLIVPPAYDFIKKKFLKPKSDTPEATLSTLATTKPETIGVYIEAQAKLLDSKTKFFNRDVVGEPSRWVINLRASIRPVFVILSVIVRTSGWAFNWNVDESFYVLMDTCISSWFSSRIL